jgi:hypothetical protein
MISRLEAGCFAEIQRSGIIIRWRKMSKALILDFSIFTLRWFLNRKPPEREVTANAQASLSILWEIARAFAVERKWFTASTGSVATCSERSKDQQRKQVFGRIRKDKFPPPR